VNTPRSQLPVLNQREGRGKLIIVYNVPNRIQTLGNMPVMLNMKKIITFFLLDVLFFSGFSMLPANEASNLNNAQIKVPAIRGAVRMSFQQIPGKSFSMKLNLPANTTGKVYLPYWSAKQKVMLNGTTAVFTREGNFAVLDGIGSGEQKLELTLKR
jgi:hypothetical protein